MRVQVMLKSGRQMNFITDKIEEQQGVPGLIPDGFQWRRHQRPGVPSLFWLNINEVAAVVTYASTDSEAGQHERDAEAAQPGGDQVELGRRVEDRDPE